MPTAHFMGSVRQFLKLIIMKQCFRHNQILCNKHILVILKFLPKHPGIVLSLVEFHIFETNLPKIIHPKEQLHAFLV